MNTKTAIADIVAGSFVLTEVTVRSKSFVKKDSAATAETIANNHASLDSGKFEKNLLASANSELKAVQKAGAACRTYLYSHTLPYSTGQGALQKGARLLPTVKSIEFMQGFGELELAYNSALTEFKAMYDQRRVQALTALGNMANANDYPEAYELDQYFGVELSVTPVPTGGQLPDSLPTEMLEAAAHGLAEKQVQSINNAIADTRERLGEELMRMAGVFKRHALGEKTKLYGSLLDNMRTVTDLLEATNVTNDSMLSHVVDEVRRCLVPDTVSIDDYKLSISLAGTAAEKAEQIANQLNTCVGDAVQAGMEVDAPSPAPAEPEPPKEPEVQVPATPGKSVDQLINETFGGDAPDMPDIDSMF